MKAYAVHERKFHTQTPQKPQNRTLSEVSLRYEAGTPVFSEITQQIYCFIDFPPTGTLSNQTGDDSSQTVLKEHSFE